MPIAGLSMQVPVAGATRSVPVPEPSMAGQASSISFADTLEALGTQTVSSLKGAESVSAAGLQNAAPIKDVVNAVMTAERSLQTALAIRDKAVSAYLEISRMTI